MKLQRTGLSASKVNVIFQQRSRYIGFYTLFRWRLHKYCQATQCTVLIEYMYTIFVTANFLKAELILHFSKYVTQVGFLWRQAGLFCRVEHAFFSKERNILAFFIKECCVLSIILRSL